MSTVRKPMAIVNEALEALDVLGELLKDLSSPKGQEAQKQLGLLRGKIEDLQKHFFEEGGQSRVGASGIPGPRGVKEKGPFSESSFREFDYD